MDLRKRKLQEIKRPTKMGGCIICFRHQISLKQSRENKIVHTAGIEPILVRKPEENRPVGEQNIDRRVILKYTFKKWGLRMCTGFICFWGWGSVTSFLNMVICP